MYLSNIETIDESRGRYLILEDLGYEGLMVLSQHERIKDVISAYDPERQQTIVTLTNIDYELSCGI